MERKPLRGIIPAMVTPFDEHEQIDEEALKSLVHHLLKKGVHGLFIAGTNGEAHLMNPDEVVRLSEIVVKEVNGRVPVISGAGRCSTMESIRLAKRLHEVGVDYISLVTPSYLVPNQIDLYHHYKKIVDSVDANFILYNIPSQTKMEISIEVAKQLAAHERVCGIKDSGGNLEKQKEYIALSKMYDFDVLNGSDSLILDTFLAGAVASVAATANVLPTLEVNLYQSFLEGNIEEAKRLRLCMDPLRNVLKKGVAPCVMKKTMNMMGVHVGIPRLPIQEPTEEVVQSIRDMLKEYREL